VEKEVTWLVIALLVRYALTAVRGTISRLIAPLLLFAAIAAVLITCPMTVQNQSQSDSVLMHAITVGSQVILRIGVQLRAPDRVVLLVMDVGRWGIGSLNARVERAKGLGIRLVEGVGPATAAGRKGIWRGIAQHHRNNLKTLLKQTANPLSY
jgi:hypothetical protein